MVHMAYDVRDHWSPLGTRGLELGMEWLVVVQCVAGMQKWKYLIRSATESAIVYDNEGT